MKIKFCIVCLIVFLTAAVFSFLPAAAQTSKSKITETNAVKKLRELYLKRNFEDGSDLGAKLAGQFPANTELQAWYILNLASSGTLEENPYGVNVNPQTSRAIELANNLQRKFPNDAWANFALGQVNNISQTYKNSVAPIDKALEINHDNEEFIFARANYLFGLRKYDEMNAWLDKNSAKLNQPRLLNLKFLALLRQSNQLPNKREKLIELFNQSSKLEPNNVSAYYLYGAWLNDNKQFNEAIPILKKAVLLAPNNIQIQREYWTAIFGQTNKTDGQKNQEFEADVQMFLRAGKNSPTSLMVVARKYDELKNFPKRDFYENLTLQKFPNTRFDEIVYFDRFRRTKKAEENVAPAQKNQFQQTNKMSWSFINRPTHFDETKLGYIYFDLLERLGYSKEVTDAQLTELINGSLKYNKKFFDYVNSETAKILADGIKLRPDSKLNGDAEKYARAGIIEAENKTEKFSPRTKAVMRGRALNTLGYVLTKEEKFDEAEKTLLDAKQLSDAKSNNVSMMIMSETTNYYLAQLYTAKKDYDKAEEYYLIDALDNDTAKKNFAEIYELRTGKKDGFDSYYSVIKQKIKDKSRQQVLDSKINNPKDAAAFSLKTIDDKTISFADLKGKIIVINIWGTWCAPCVGEMPQLQQLYKKYENDKDVAIITMDTNDELETV